MLILIAVLKICCLIIPVPPPEIWNISFQFLVMSDSPFVFPPGARAQVPKHEHSFFSTSKLPSGKETPAQQLKGVGGVAACNFSKTALVPSYIHPDILSKNMCVCACGPVTPQTLTYLPVKEIGVVLDRSQRQWAKFKINKQKSRKLNMLLSW